MPTPQDIKRAIRKHQRQQFWAGVRRAWPVWTLGLVMLAAYIVLEIVAPNHRP
jgi:hypothetical protein